MVKRREDIDVTEFNNEKVMMDIENGKYYALNEVGALIWDLIEEKIIVSNIINKLLEEYDIDNTRCTKEVLDYLINLDKEKLILVE